ncbi:DUF4893 domain-containing protein [Sphingomonas sp. AP4-R1]|nr:DUF4893 domain-containing protein [Sphingomonas sp. AP4-R1]
MAMSGGAAAAKRAPAPDAWRTIITLPDRSRLRNWRDAWILGLDQARAEGDAAEVAREGSLLDPDAGLENAAIPDGDYACRMIKLGRKGATGQAYMAYPAGTCRIAADRLRKLDGPQRPDGHFWPFDATRMVFLGSMALADEPRALDYGRDADRNMVGLIERIGPQKWRLILPQPRWESQADIVELVPKAGGSVMPPAGGM